MRKRRGGGEKQRSAKIRTAGLKFLAGALGSEEKSRDRYRQAHEAGRGLPGKKSGHVSDNGGRQGLARCTWKWSGQREQCPPMALAGQARPGHPIAIDTGPQGPSGRNSDQHDF